MVRRAADILDAGTALEALVKLLCDKWPERREDAVTLPVVVNAPPARHGPVSQGRLGHDEALPGDQNQLSPFAPRFSPQPLPQRRLQLYFRPCARSGVVNADTDGVHVLRASCAPANTNHSSASHTSSTGCR